MHSKRAERLAALAGVIIATTALMGVGAMSARADQIGPREACPLKYGQCSYTSGWEEVNGSCQAQLTYVWTRSDDEIDVHVEVRNSNPFRSCHTYATAYLETIWGKVDPSGSYYGFACGAWDPTCRSDQTRNYPVFNAVPATDIAIINQTWSVLTTS